MSNQKTTAITISTDCSKRQIFRNFGILILTLVSSLAIHFSLSIVI